jgi:hypothetical protein
MEMNGQLLALASLLPGKEPLYPPDRKLVGPRVVVDPADKETYLASAGN